VPQESRASVSRVQRSLAFFSLTLIGISVIAIIVIMILGGAGVRKPTASLEVVYLFPAIALPLGALGIIALFIVGAVERRRYNAGGGSDDTRQSK
jgi:uncharacterized integral membrane protein